MCVLALLSNSSNRTDISHPPISPQARRLVSPEPDPFLWWGGADGGANRAYTIISSRVLLNIKNVLEVCDTADGSVCPVMQLETIRSTCDRSDAPALCAGGGALGRCGGRVS